MNGSLRVSIERIFPTLLFLCAAALMAILIRPFAGAFFASIVLAALMSPWQKRLSRRLGDRPHLAAGMLTVFAAAVLVLPLAGAGALLTREVVHWTGWFTRTLETHGISGVLEPLPESAQTGARWMIDKLPEGLRRNALASGNRPIQRTSMSPPDPTSEASAAEELTGDEILASVDASTLGATANQAGILFGELFSLSVSSGLLMAALFFLLSEGERLYEYIVALIPMKPKRTRDLMRELRQVSSSVLIATVVTAFAQTAVAGIGYWIAGTPAVLLVLGLTLICAFIPVIGAGTVVALAGLFELAAGGAGMGIFLILWGVAAVGSVDNFLKPMLASDRARLPSGVVFFAMICGLSVFGPLGLVAGPLIASFFAVTARLAKVHEPEPVALSA